GLPGIPLAIADPTKSWVLLDKSQKKTRFLTQVIAELGLKNVSVACSRCEDFRMDACFDSIISRAFGTIALLIESTQHLLCSDGQFLAMKGSYPEHELAEIPTGFALLDVKKLTIKGLQAERHLARIKRGSA
ncbi:MAG TPA: 16S rRNA (guanine(527)-N(7))-methyltransferase RsmG, partial [Gammaproteobacteria bacterium]|nr:16S rRNA (guanine(527)-N(7))-methyltransferase RsmG [Gammaproteobacteria bacterium]